MDEGGAEKKVRRGVGRCGLYGGEDARERERCVDCEVRLRSQGPETNPLPLCPLSVPAGARGPNMSWFHAGLDPLFWVRRLPHASEGVLVVRGDAVLVLDLVLVLSLLRSRT